MPCTDGIPTSDPTSLDARPRSGSVGLLIGPVSGGKNSTMNTPEERHKEQMLAAAYDDSRQGRAGAMAFLGRLLKHFDQHEPAVAGVIRFGFKDHDYETTTIACNDCCTGCVADVCNHCGQMADSDDATFWCPVINYPEGVEPSDPN